MKACTRLESGIVELYFYDELNERDRAAMADHLATCGDCRQGLEDLVVIRAALLTRPVVSAPPGGDWSGFMTKLETAVASAAATESQASREPARRSANVGEVVDFRAAPAARAQQFVPLRLTPYLAIAAMLVLAAASLVFVARSGWGRSPARTADAGVTGSAPVAPVASPATASSDETIEAAFAALSEQHFERSKLVVLGIASKDARRSKREDWEYERQLATTLLADTRLYRLAAEERGMKRIAAAMSDLELVLLQTALGAASGPEDLEQIQRLIVRRDLVTKMELAAAGI
jgi:hypothetical protein